MALENPSIPAADQAEWLSQWMYDNCVDLDEEIPDPIGTPPGQTPCEANCEQLLSVLESDVSPSGQYYQDDQWLLDHMAGWNFVGMSTLSPADFRAAFDNLPPTAQQTLLDVMVEDHPEYCHYEWCILPLIQASCGFDSWFNSNQNVNASNYDQILSYNSTSVVVNDPLGTNINRIPNTDPFFALQSPSTTMLDEMIDRLMDYPTGANPLNPATGTAIEVIEAQLADPNDADNAIDTWEEMEMFRNIYLGLKASIIAQANASGGCSYLYPSGNNPSYLDGKQIRVFDPSGAGLMTNGTISNPPIGGSGNPFPVFNGDLAGLCQQNCEQWAQEWRQQLAGCIQWQDSIKDDNPPTYYGSFFYLGGYEAGFYPQYSWPVVGEGSQTLIDWIVYGGDYDTGTGIVSLTGLIDHCQANCEGPPSDISGC
jgi:hypothetical protein